MSNTIASLKAQCEATGGSFTFVQTANTPLDGGGNMPFQPAPPFQAQVPHATKNLTAISFSAVYRTHQIAGYCLIVDTVVAALYVQPMLDLAASMLSSWDLRDGTIGIVPTVNNPLGIPTTGFPNPSTGQQGS